MSTLLIYCDECDRDIEADDYTTRKLDVTFDPNNNLMFTARIECPYCRHINRVVGMLEPKGYMII